MMEKHEYSALRIQSSGLFNNGLVLPVAIAIVRETPVEGTFGARELRERLGGRAESNQIRETVDRIASIGAVQELPHLGRPHPRAWIRSHHPFWDFVDAWAQRTMSAEADPSET
jgi:hypothetical protein